METHTGRTPLEDTGKDSAAMAQVPQPASSRSVVMQRAERAFPQSHRVQSAGPGLESLAERLGGDDVIEVRS